MNFKWTENLVEECRNTRFVPYQKMSAWAKRALDCLRRDAVSGKPCHVEYYDEAGWHPAVRGFRCVGDKAYRIIPGWNPLAKKGGAA